MGTRPKDFLSRPELDTLKVKQTSLKERLMTCNPVFHRLLLGCATCLLGATAAATDMPRTADGKPDLSGTYDIATLTPLQRPEEFGETLYMTPEQAEKITLTRAERVAAEDIPSDPDRGAPPSGGDGTEGAGGNVGGYNSFWIDAGDSVALDDGKFRTSIISDPPNGRYPPETPEAKLGQRIVADQLRTNDGSAYWLEWNRPGPFDDPERLLASDRCVASFRGAVPATPSVYNNLHRIVQTDDQVMILNEMVHDARVIRMNSEHLPADMKFWLGDSIGRWEGDTLVVDTANFKGYWGFTSTTPTLHVVERFTRTDADSLHYEFTVNDPGMWTGTWKGDFVWPRTTKVEERVYEYACHEGNYAVGNMLRGARLIESETLVQGGGR
ncbi:MAG: hypothetical protein ACI9UU_003952 [Candidatus Azotimanducaceae bacterium]|jgi:hypothetical protein